MALTPVLQRERLERSGWQFLMPPTAGRRLLCVDALDGNTMLLLAETAGELTVVDDRAEVLASLQELARQAGLTRVSFALLGKNGELPGVEGAFDGLVVHDPLGRVLVADAPRLAALCALAAARLAPGGFLYLGFRNRYGYTRLRASGGPANALLSVRGVLRAVREHGLAVGRPHPLLLDGPRVLEMVPESGYRSHHNRFLASERARQFVLRGFGARHLAPAYALLAFRGSPSASWLESFLDDPAVQALCPGARLRRFLVLNLGKVVLSLSPADRGRPPLIAVIAPDGTAVARRQAEASLLQELSRLPEHLARTVPRLYGERPFQEARVFLLGEFEGTTVDRPSPVVPSLTRLATTWLIGFHEATRRDTTLGADDWPRLCGELFEDARKHNSRLREELSLLEPEVHRAVLGRVLPTVWMHGDYKLENIVFARDYRRLLGVIDWELSRQQALPLLDLLYLLVYNRVIESGHEQTDVIARVVEDGWTEKEEAALAEYEQRFAGVAQIRPALLAMFFVHHVAARCRYEQSRESTAEKLRVIIRGLRERLAQAPAPDPS